MLGFQVLGESCQAMRRPRHPTAVNAIAILNPFLKPDLMTASTASSAAVLQPRPETSAHEQCLLTRTIELERKKPKP